MSNKVFIKYAELARKAEQKRGTREALDWFARRIRKDVKITADQVTENLKAAKVIPGEMIIFSYDPKHKETLPYYDKNPLVIVLDKTLDGWFGVNIHYLPPSIRAQLLFDIQYNRRNTQQIKMMLEKNEMTKPCLKRYLITQLQSRPLAIPKTEWDIAIQLPFESFEKVAMKNIWKISRSKI